MLVRCYRAPHHPLKNSSSFLVNFLSQLEYTEILLVGDLNNVILTQLFDSLTRLNPKCLQKWTHMELTLT